MSINPEIPAPTDRNPAAERAAGTNDRQKLLTSLAYRSKDKKEEADLGTAERRPRRGMVYDAPLGLKF